MLCHFVTAPTRLSWPLLEIWHATMSGHTAVETRIRLVFTDGPELPGAL